MPERYPNMLFHYTSLETLALILATKKLKFTLLSELNDPLEGKTSDFQHAERMIYSSSWTANASDTLPMWKMYSDLRGVRICLPSEMFDTQAPIESGNWPPATINYAELKNPPRPKMNCLWNGEQLVGELKQIMGPDKVEYVDAERVGDIPKVLTKANSSEGEKYFATLSHVGLNKAVDWEFEAEWRFRLPFSIAFSTIQGLSAKDAFSLMTF
ncbi:hypothetical protein [Ruegeria sp.]|uniref:hypothetical protein n=1 Tax=Ruegeria sp. TaxID=1879320 RepID=UPI003C7B9296